MNNETKAIPENVSQALHEYQRAYKKFKDAETDLEKLKTTIKEYLNSCDEKKMNYMGSTFSVITQDRSKINEARAVQILKEKELLDCIITKEVPDEGAVKGAIETGRLSIEDLASAVDQNLVVVLKYTAPKAKKGDI